MGQPLVGEPFSEGPAVTPLPGPKSRWDSPVSSDTDGPDANSFANGWEADYADDDTAPQSVNKNTVG